MTTASDACTGVLVDPTHSDYDHLRTVWNGMIDRYPRLIIQCRTAQEVSDAVRATASWDLPLTVRGGGHNVAGLSVADDAILLDLSLMRGVSVEPRRQLANAEGGCLLSDLDEATIPHGLACPVGVVSETGLGGLALGGGYGWLSRRWGMTCDHILAAEVVLADGSIVETSSGQRPELLWGVRGGGGNFGVVTRFTLQLRPIDDVWHHTATYTLDRAAHALDAYRVAAAECPDELQIVGAFTRTSSNGRIEARLRLTAVHLGGLGGRSTVEDFFATTRPDGDQCGQLLPYKKLQSLGDGTEPRGRRYYTKSCYLEAPSKGAIDVLLESAARLPSPQSAIDVGHLGGAIRRVPDSTAAFPARAAEFICSASAAWDPPTLDDHAVAWARSLIADLEPWRQLTSYVNYSQVGDASAAELFGTDRHARLASLKAEVDPSNLFASNHNVRPAASPTRGLQKAPPQPSALALPHVPPQTWGEGRDEFVRALSSPWYSVLAGLQDTVTNATHRYARSHGVRSLHFPITTRTITCPNGLGSDASPVPVTVGGVDTYLADSMQFMLEYGCRLARDGCHCIMPSFRSDEPDTSHLGQFVHAEAEIPGDLDTLIDYVTGYIRSLATAILDEHEADLVNQRGSCEHLRTAVSAIFTRITFDEAAALLADDVRYVGRNGGGRVLTRAGEQRLIELIGPFVWVTHFDHVAVAFYQAFCPDNPSLALNGDLLFGVGEIVGAGQRHRTGAEARRALALHAAPASEYDWYCRMKDEWPLLTSGFGLGVDRFLLWVLGHDDIRDIPLVSRVGETARWPASVDRP